MVKPLVSAVIVNYNKRELTSKLLDSLKKTAFPKDKLEVIVVDNASSDGSVEFLRKKYPHARVIANDRNAHWCEGVNMGVRASRGKYVMLFDNDILADKNWLKELLKILENDESVAVAGPLQFSKYKKFSDYTFEGYGTTTLVQFHSFLRGIDKHTKKPLDMFSVTGNFLFRRDLVDVPFDPDYRAYAEETYFCWLMRLRGYRAVEVPTAVLYHAGESTYGLKGLKGFAAKFGERNRLLNMFLFYSPANLIRMIPYFLFLGVFMNIYGIRKLPMRLGIYWYFVSNLRRLLIKRRSIQGQRKVNDREIIRLMSCNLFDESVFSNALMRFAVRVLNRLSYAYCFIAGIRTAEFFNQSFVYQKRA